MEKDIRELIERFMAGLTSIEEEKYMAEYLRTHEVDEDLIPYKRMFAWFDKGMPAKDGTGERTACAQSASREPAQEPCPYRKRHGHALSRKLFYMVMAAAVVLLLIMAWPRVEEKRTPMGNDTTVRHLPSNEKFAAKTDTLTADTTTTSTPGKKNARPHIRRDRFKSMPPKTYLADARPDSTTEEAEKIAEREVREAELRQELILNAIYEEYHRTDIGLDLYITAMENYDTEEECY